MAKHSKGSVVTFLEFPKLTRVQIMQAANVFAGAQQKSDIISKLNFSERNLFEYGLWMIQQGLPYPWNFVSLCPFTGNVTGLTVSVPSKPRDLNTSSLNVAARAHFEGVFYPCGDYCHETFCRNGGGVMSASDTLFILTTVVAPSARGRGIGGSLGQKCSGSARENGYLNFASFTASPALLNSMGKAGIAGGPLFFNVVVFFCRFGYMLNFVVELVSKWALPLTGKYAYPSCCSFLPPARSKMLDDLGCNTLCFMASHVTSLHQVAATDKQNATKLTQVNCDDDATPLLKRKHAMLMMMSKLFFAFVVLAVLLAVAAVYNETYIDPSTGHRAVLLPDYSQSVLLDTRPAPFCWLDTVWDSWLPDSQYFRLSENNNVFPNNHWSMSIVFLVGMSSLYLLIVLWGTPAMMHYYTKLQEDWEKNLSPEDLKALEEENSTSSSSSSSAGKQQQQNKAEAFEKHFVTQTQLGRILAPLRKSPSSIAAFHNLNCMLASFYAMYLMINACRSSEYVDLSFFGNQKQPAIQVPNAKFATWVFYIYKYIEHFDTYFMVANLPKSRRQISFLHVYHHLSVVFVVWLYIMHSSGGDEYLPVCANSFIHTNMYFHFFNMLFNSKKPSWQPLIRFYKPLMTSMQLMQFVLILSQSLFALYYQSGWAPHLIITQMIYMLSMIYLFSRFYLEQKQRLVVPKQLRQQQQEQPQQQQQASPAPVPSADDDDDDEKTSKVTPSANFNDAVVIKRGHAACRG